MHVNVSVGHMLSLLINTTTVYTAHIDFIDRLSLQFWEAEKPVNKWLLFVFLLIETAATD